MAGNRRIGYKNLGIRIQWLTTVQPVSHVWILPAQRGQQFPHGTGACLLSSQRSPGGANIEEVFW